MEHYADRPTSSAGGNRDNHADYHSQSLSYHRHSQRADDDEAFAADQRDERRTTGGQAARDTDSASSPTSPAYADAGCVRDACSPTVTHTHASNGDTAVTYTVADCHADAAGDDNAHSGCDSWRYAYAGRYRYSDTGGYTNSECYNDCDRIAWRAANRNAHACDYAYGEWQPDGKPYPHRDGGEYP